MKRMGTLDNAVTTVFFGGVFLYFVYGAITGNQFIPYSRHEGGVHLRGGPAWIVSLAPVLIWFGIQIRHGLIERLGRRSRTALEFTFLLAGIAALVGGMHLGNPSCNC